jgi:hypothetical protein
VKRRSARNIVGIWLALGLSSLASCAPPSTQVAAQNRSPASVGSAAPTASQPEQHFTSNAPVDNAQSTALTNYLHSHQLPLVGGRVLASNGGPRQAILYGFVATPFGKADAVDRTRQWLNDSGAQIDNRIKIEPELANPAGNPNGATADDNSDLSNPDIQKYQDQQNQQLTRQQQQYMSQGQMPPGFTLLLPLLMLGGSLGGGGSGFSFGGGGFGSPYGSPYGSYGSPYSSPSPPPPGYGPPYGP